MRDENGQLVHITPLDQNVPRDDFLFLRHLGVFLCMRPISSLLSWVIMACAGFPAGAQQTGTLISLPGVSASGVFDLFVADTAPGQRAWMSFSAVDPSPRWPEKDTRTITTRLAYSDDQGATWIDLGARINDISEAPSGSKAQTWVNEVSSLVYDPYAPQQERWKLFWHHYLRLNEDGQFQNGWIGYKSAATPQALRPAKEVKLFGARAYDAVNDDPQSKTYPPVGGPPVVHVHALHKDLGMCLALSEPGAMVMQSGLYMSLVCYEPRVQNVIGLLGMGLLGVKARVIMLKCDSPCYPASSGAWRYIATMLTDDDAQSVGFRGYSAPDLFAQEGRAYLIVTRVSDKPWKGSYNGCDIYRFASLETAVLEQDHGKPHIVEQVRGHRGAFSGACTYQPSVAASGFLYGEVKFADRPIFQIFQTGVGMVDTLRRRAFSPIYR